MNRYKIFVATYSYLIQSLSTAEVEYQVVDRNTVDSSNVNYLWSSTHGTLEEAEQRIADNRVKNDRVYRIVQAPKTVNRVYSGSMEFSTENAAQRWLDSQKESRSHDTFDCRIEEVVIDQDDLENYEFKPTYSVVVYMNIVKRFEVDVDTADSDYDDCDDEYDIEQRVRDQIESGDMECEIECADEWDTEINEIEVTED